MRFTLPFALAMLCAEGAHGITIETVPVGDVGNPNDPGNPLGPNFYGSVNYAYNIGKYEVTVGQYTAFLNAVAATDTYGLYNLSMGGTPGVNPLSILRSGSAGSYTYSVIGSANQPATFVTWRDAARFANWLHNGQPSGGQNATTTEDGAYTLNGATDFDLLDDVTRNATAKWFIPTHNEWYKAAYYQPVGKGGDFDDYWLYPTRTNDEPNSDQPPGDASIVTNVANFYRDDGVANGYNNGSAVTGTTDQNHLTDVGAYASSPSYYGTFDQGGNVWEWSETILNDNRRVNGGSWNFGSISLQATNRRRLGWHFESFNLGFRVASIYVPEPSSALLAVGIFAPFAAYRRRRC